MRYKITLSKIRIHAKAKIMASALGLSHSVDISINAPRESAVAVVNKKDRMPFFRSSDWSFLNIYKIKR